MKGFYTQEVKRSLSVITRIVQRLNKDRKIKAHSMKRIHRYALKDGSELEPMLIRALRWRV